MQAVNVIAANHRVKRRKDEGASKLLQRIDERLHILKELAKGDESILEDYEPELCVDRPFMLAAIAQSPHALRLACDELRDDPLVVHTALRLNGMTLMHASERLRNERDTVLLAVQQDGCALGCASRDMRADKDVVIAAVRKGSPTVGDALPGIMGVGGPLHFADTALKRDRAVVAAAVKQVCGNENGDREGGEEGGALRSLASLHLQLVNHWMQSVDSAAAHNTDEYLMIR